MTSVNKGLLQINICVILLGGTALFAKLISLPADSITFFRSIFGGLSLVAIMIMTHSPFRLQSPKDYWMIIFTALLTAAHWVSYFHAIQISTVAIGILSLYTFPIMTALIEPLFDREMIRLGSIILTIIGFFGILLIIPKFEISNQMTAGVMWGLVSAVLFTARNITVRKTLSHVSSITTMFYQLVIVSVLLLPFVSFQNSLLVDNRLYLLVLLGVLFTATPHVLLVASLRQLKASTASLILCMHPMYSILFAAIIISEIPSTKVLIGGIIIFGISVYESIRVRLENKKVTYHQQSPQNVNIGQNGCSLYRAE